MESYSQIMRNIYYEKRKYIMGYIVFCIFVSIVLFGLSSVDFADAGTGRIIKTLGGSFGETIAPIAGATLLLGMDPPSGVFCMSIISAILQYVPSHAIHNFGNVIGIDNLETMANYSFGLFDINAVRIFCLVWFVVSKIPKSTRVTLPFGITFEDIESKMGVVVIVAVMVVQFLKSIPLGDNIVSAATINYGIEDAVSSGLNALTSFVVMVVFMVIYVVMRLSAYFVDIVIMPITGSTPFVAAIIEIIKTSFTAFLCWVYFIHPEVFYVLFAIILVIAILLFRTAYSAVKYFQGLYSKPTFRRIRSKITKKEIDMPLIAEKLPKKLKAELIKQYGESSDGNIDADFVIPVYLHNRLGIPAKNNVRDKWYWTCKDQENFLVKKELFKKKFIRVKLSTTSEKIMFINKGIAYIEVMNFTSGQENIGKNLKAKKRGINIAFSSEYNNKYEEIKECSGFSDYKEYKNIIKDAAKREKELSKPKKTSKFKFPWSKEKVEV